MITHPEAQEQRQTQNPNIEELTKHNLHEIKVIESNHQADTKQFKRENKDLRKQIV